MSLSIDYEGKDRDDDDDYDDDDDEDTGSNRCIDRPSTVSLSSVEFDECVM